MIDDEDQLDEKFLTDLEDRAAFAFSFERLDEGMLASMRAVYDMARDGIEWEELEGMYRQHAARLSVPLAEDEATE